MGKSITEYFMFLKMCTALQDVLKENKPAISISHDDLDGYGCTTMMAAYLNIKKRNSNISFVNTPILGKGLYDDVIGRAYIEKRLITPNKRVYVIITDLGGISIEHLLSEYRDDEVTFFIIDHHQSMYVNDNRIANIGKWQVEHNEYRNDTTFKVKHQNCTIWMNIGYGQSATKTISEMLIDSSFNYEVLKKFHFIADEISRYDTGDFGNWKIDMNDTQHKISVRMYLNTLLSVFKNPEMAKTFSQNYPATFVKNIVEYITTSSIVSAIEHEDDKSILQSEMTTVGVSNYVDYQFTNTTFNFLLNMSNQYQQWLNNIQPYLPKHLSEEFTLKDSEEGKINMLTTAAMMSMINCDDSDKEQTTVFAIVEDTEDLMDYNFSVFASAYFKEVPECVLLIRVPSEKGPDQVISLRSPIDGLNCFEIAAINGGGGHPGAAGFPIFKNA